ncbi:MULTISPECIES: LysR substrate-binding domain-containing protein [Silvimonas]|uniref:LysR substrate-binding domain-containing protein n=1 Tax=Silvimonas TaxID=300264 RepID=UPI0024B35F79|nr:MULTISPECIES: LysR substrate-binding domain-containing protein [Silvimonas]MDR3430107.1 LysR substrate-binding domain-containing protein [Silvimonas sp.]
MQDLNDMLFFAEVVEAGGFSSASRALGIPKSRLSRRVAELEAHLGVRLLQRTTRKLAVTEIGELYFRHCVAIRDEARAATEVVEHVQSAPRGTIKVACPVTLAQTVVGEIIPQFMMRYPQVKLNMIVTNRVIDLLEEGIDVALRVRPTLQDSASLVIKQFGTTNAVLLASPAQLARQGQPSHPDELGWLDTLAMSATDGRATWSLVGPGGVKQQVTHYPRYVADDMVTLKYAAVGGVGAVILPEYLCRPELTAGTLVPVLPDWTSATGYAHAVFPSRRGLVPAVRHFLDFLGEELLAERCTEVMNGTL